MKTTIALLLIGFSMAVALILGAFVLFARGHFTLGWLFLLAGTAMSVWCIRGVPDLPTGLTGARGLPAKWPTAARGLTGTRGTSLGNARGVRRPSRLNR